MKGRRDVTHLTETPAVGGPPQVSEEEEEEEENQLHAERLLVHMSARVHAELLPVACSYVSDVTSAARAHARTHARCLWIFIYLFVCLFIDD